MVPSRASEFSKARHVILMDYGVGNIGSIAGSLRRLGYRVSASNQPQDFEAADAVILPGVGAMPAAMRSLRQSSLDQAVYRLLDRGKVPVIGICLGMQLMFEYSEEGDCSCLGLLKGSVRRLPNGICHVGWSWNEAIVDGNVSRTAYYFNHSYFADVDATFTFGQAVVEGHGSICTMVRLQNFWGVQFHPEKSQTAGATLLDGLIGGCSDA